MKSVFWGNYKGGVGKTTSTFQVAGHFASRGKKVLLIDLDPQCSLSHICCSRGGLNKNLEKINVDQTLNYVLELYMREMSYNTGFAFQLLIGKIDSVVKEYMKQTIHCFTNGSLRSNYLYFIPSSLFFSNSRMNELAQYMGGNIYNIFLIKQLLQDLREIGADETYRFDYVFFDCPPTTNMLTQSVFLASDYYIIPTICDEVSVQGVPDYITEIEKTRNKYILNDNIRGVLFEKVFPKESKSQFVGVFETLYKNRGGTPKNYPIIEDLDRNISSIPDVCSILSHDRFINYRYAGNPPGNITTKNIFSESIDNRDARKTGESVPLNTASATITEEYQYLAQILMNMI